MIQADYQRAGTRQREHLRRPPVRGDRVRLRTEVSFRYIDVSVIEAETLEIRAGEEIGDKHPVRTEYREAEFRLSRAAVEAVDLPAVVPGPR